jgi:uncharacterized protein
MADYLAPGREFSRRTWFIALIFILVTWIGLGSYLTLVMMEYWQVTFLTGSLLLFYIAIHGSFLCFALGMIIVNSFLFHRPLQTLLSPAAPIWRWHIFIETLGLWLCLLIFSAAIESLLFPGSIVFKGLVLNWPSFLIAILLLTPIQVWAEEYFFRVFMPQFFYRFLAFPFLAIVLSALCFTLVHLQNSELNTPQAWLVIGYYFSYALLAGFLAYYELGLERVLGWHLATNLFAFLFLSYDLETIRTPALFHSSRFDPVWNLAQFVLLSLIGYGILYLKKSKELHT